MKNGYTLYYNQVHNHFWVHLPYMQQYIITTLQKSVAIYLLCSTQELKKSSFNSFKSMVYLLTTSGRLQCCAGIEFLILALLIPSWYLCSTTYTYTIVIGYYIQFFIINAKYFFNTTFKYNIILSQVTKIKSEIFIARYLGFKKCCLQVQLLQINPQCNCFEKVVGYHTQFFIINAKYFFDATFLYNT